MTPWSTWMTGRPSHGAPGGVSFLADASAPSTGSDRLDALLKKRQSTIDDAGADVDRELTRLADTIAKALREYVAERTDGSAAAVKAAVQAAQLDDVLDILRVAGIDDARGEWLQSLSDLSLQAAETAKATGLISDPAAVLDSEAVASALAARTGDMVAKWDSTVVRPMADKMLQGLHNMVLAETLEDASRRIAESMRISIPQAATEARTQAAMFDRFAAAEVAEEADPTGEWRWVYVHPVDGLQRPFCRHLTGKHFARADLAALNNAQTVEHPIFSCGGFNCRGCWVQMPEKIAQKRGYEAGGPDDVQAANLAAVLARGGKRK